MLSVNLLLPTARYFVLKSNHVGGIHRRGNLGADFDLEDPNVTPPTDLTSTSIIFQHIGLLSGRSKYNDRDFFTFRDPSTFFRLDQVFIMLWDTTSLHGTINVNIDDEPGLGIIRRHRIVTDGAYPGPYFGPTTVRRFLVM